MNEFILEEKMLLSEALKRYFPDSSTRNLQLWTKHGRVLVNGSSATRFSQSLEKGDSLFLRSEEKRAHINGIKILYQDRWIIAIDKPEGLLSVPSLNPAQPNALILLRNHLKTQSIFAVHRIDRETSGVLLFAKGKEAEERFDALFEEHRLERQYYAIVEGQMSERNGTWTSYLQEKENYDVVSVEPSQGRIAITHFDRYRMTKCFSFLLLRLQTGRKHQIRVQCSEIGHPVIGDKRYGAQTNPLKRLGLHAHLLAFAHPFTGKPLCITSPFPQAFSKLGEKN